MNLCTNHQKTVETVQRKEIRHREHVFASRSQHTRKNDLERPQRGLFCYFRQKYGRVCWFWRTVSSLTKKFLTDLEKETNITLVHQCSNYLLLPNKPPFSWAHEFFGAVFQRGHSRDGLSLFHHVPQVWRLEWSGESMSRVWNYLEASSLTCSVPGLKWFKGWVSLGWLTKQQNKRKMYIWSVLLCGLGYS